MSLLARRIRRLGESRPVRNKTWETALEDFLVLKRWLAERGYPDHLAALEAGESGPAGLQPLLQEYAGYDRRQRAFACIMAALKAGNLPNENDLRRYSGEC
jgi:hypothetical protein